MISNGSMSSLSLSSSENLDRFFEEKIMFIEKSDKLRMCVEELKLVSDKLKDNSNSLKEYEKRLMVKQKQLVAFSSGLDAFIKSEIQVTCDKAMNEHKQVYVSLDHKFKALNKSHERLQSSFQALKAHNGSLRTQLEASHASETSLKAEMNKLRLKLSRCNNRSCSGTNRSRLASDVATQTAEGPDALMGDGGDVVAIDTGNATATATPAPPASTGPLVAALRLAWAQLVHKSLSTALSNPPGVSGTPGPTSITAGANGSNHGPSSVSDLCLLIIPMAADQLRDVLLLPAAATRVSRQGPIVSGRPRRQQQQQRPDIVYQLLEMVHFSLVHLDISRAAIRKPMMSSLTRFSEELVSLLRSKSDKRTYKKEIARNGLEMEVLISLVALRIVNSANDLALVVTYIIDMIDNIDEAFESFLSKLLLVPLLCRWSSTFNCYGSISSKVISLVHRSLDKTAHVSLNNCPTIMNGTGLDQLILLTTRTPIISSEVDPTNNYHVLVVLLDLLYSSKPPSQELVVDIIEKIVLVKSIRKMLKDLGIVGIITGFITKYSDSTVSQTNIQCLAKLRMILTQLNVDATCK